MIQAKSNHPGEPARHPALNAGNRILGGLAKIGLRTSFLRADKLIAAAERRTGLSNWGDVEFCSRLEKLLESARTDAKLNPFGALVLEQFILLQLGNRLTKVEEARQHPEALTRPVRAPLFILGLPRSGTTVLHRLLSSHPDALYMPLWMQLEPFPAPSSRLWSSRGGLRARKAALKVALSPTHLSDLPSQHEIGVHLPEECRNIMTSSLLSPAYSSIWPVLNYDSWFRGQDARPAYQYLRETLQLLQRDLPQQRWVLKDPWHMTQVELLRELFPDARFVFTQRNPVKALASSLSETLGLHTLFSDHLDRERSIRGVCETTQEYYHRGKAAREALGGDPRAYDVQFKAFLADPIGVSRALHEHFGYRWDEEVEACMKNFMQQNPRHKGGKHEYSLADFGLTEAQAEALF